MSTLPIQAPHASQTWSFPTFARIASVMATVFDVFTEAQKQAIAAHKRYPFADW